jgi:hypothetical protein
MNRLLMFLMLVAAFVLDRWPVRSADTAAEFHGLGVAHHLERSLDAAAEGYDRALALDAPRDARADEWTLIERFAPRVFAQRDEPFELRDVAAVLHPDTGEIAYHLFWDDDIDFPDDNDPSDHEVVWVLPADDRRAIRRYATYFHGRTLVAGEPALADAAAHGGRPAVYVQWGKHGSMPRGWEAHRIVAERGETESKYYPVDTPITLLEYNRGTWKKLAGEGRRALGNPIAARLAWPARFSGSWDDFIQFTRRIDTTRHLRNGRLAVVSRWNSGPLNRWLIRYNFRPKTEWPDDAR